MFLNQIFAEEKEGRFPASRYILLQSLRSAWITTEGRKGFQTAKAILYKGTNWLVTQFSFALPLAAAALAFFR